MVETPGSIEAHVRHSVGTDLFELITMPPADPLELCQKVFEACDSTYLDDPEQLPGMKAGRLVRIPEMKPYKYPSILRLEGIAELPYTTSYIQEGRSARSELHCLVRDGGEQIIARFDGFKRRGEVRAVKSRLLTEDVPIHKIIGGALVCARLGESVEGLADWLDDWGDRETGFPDVPPA